MFTWKATEIIKEMKKERGRQSPVCMVLRWKDGDSQTARAPHIRRGTAKQHRCSSRKWEVSTPLEALLSSLHEVHSDHRGQTRTLPVPALRVSPGMELLTIPSSLLNFSALHLASLDRFYLTLWICYAVFELHFCIF